MFTTALIGVLIAVLFTTLFGALHARQPWVLAMLPGFLFLACGIGMLGAAAILFVRGAWFGTLEEQAWNRSAAIFSLGIAVAGSIPGALWLNIYRSHLLPRELFAACVAEFLLSSAFIALVGTLL